MIENSMEYMSFLEFGSNALSRESSWFIRMTDYSSIINALDSGLSQALGALIKVFHQDPFDLSRAGMTLQFDDDDVTRFFAKIDVVLQDGGAHKYTWMARGDGASRFCPLCNNLFSAGSKLADGSHLLRCDVIRLEALIPSTDDELRRRYRYLVRMAPTIESEEAFNELQQALGLTYGKRAILADPSLDNLISPTRAYIHDWMHGLFVDGVVNLCVYLVFEIFIDMGHTGIYESFAEFLSHWKLPGRLHGDHLSEVFSADRRDKHRTAKHIKCQASDLLSIFPILALYVHIVLLPLGIHSGACGVIATLFYVVDLVVASARIDVEPSTLLAAVHRFLDSFVGSFGSECMTPKFHWLLHLPEALLRFGRLLNCFCLERKHRWAKRYATELQNTSRSPSVSLLSEVLCHNIASMSESCAFDFHVGLIAPRPAPKKTRALILRTVELEADVDAEVSVAKDVRISPLARCQTGDVVLVRDGDSFRAGRVKLNCDVSGIPLSFITPFTLHSRRPGTSLAIWQAGDEAEAFEAGDILAAVEYCVYPSGRIGTLLPIEYNT